MAVCSLLEVKDPAVAARVPIAINMLVDVLHDVSDLHGYEYDYC